MSKRKSSKIAVDTTSGAMAYNRFDMQVSQVLHMAIELYDTDDFLFVLDHYDDISLFDDENNPTTVSYYQMKTSGEYILFSTVLKDEWIAKLYSQQVNTDWITKEMGLITNCPIHVTLSGQKKIVLDSPRTGFVDFNPEIVDKVKKDISDKIGIPVSDVDLSKMFHIKTTLSIERHRDLVEKEFGDFLNEHYCGITCDAVKTVFSTMIELLTKRQSVEIIDSDAKFDVVRQKKGIARSDIEKVIQRSMLLAIPPVNKVIMYFSKGDLLSVYNAYTRLISDRERKDFILERLILRFDAMMKSENLKKEEQIEDYIKRISKMVRESDPRLSAIYDFFYLQVVGTCVYINELRSIS